MNLLDLPNELLEHALRMLGTPDLARLEATCRSLKSLAGEVLGPWREVPPETKAHWTPKSMKLLRHVRALFRKLNVPVVDAFALSMAQVRPGHGLGAEILTGGDIIRLCPRVTQERSEYVRGVFAMKGRNTAAADKVYLELKEAKYGWNFWYTVDLGGGLTSFVAQWQGRVQCGSLLNCAMVYKPSAGWKAEIYGLYTEPNGPKGDETRREMRCLFDDMVRDLAGGATIADAKFDLICELSAHV